jgi:hypothetical protein
LTETTVYALAVSGTNLFAGTFGGVFLSTDNGTSWTAVNAGLTYATVYALVVSGTNLFAGTAYGGVYLSTDNGTSWTAVNSGLTSSLVYALAVSGANIFAGTEWGGVWSRPLADFPPLPIQMASFAASMVRDRDVEVAWRTVSETNNYGFEVYRKLGESGEWKKIAFVEGHGTTLVPQSYTYVDHALAFGRYYYRVKQIDLNGKSETYPEIEVTVGVAPDKFVLAQNYPNPFNPSTTICFSLPKSGYVTLKVYDILGREVETLVDGQRTAGSYSVEWTPKNLASGVYLYRIKAGAFSDMKKLVLVK